ncbi:MAG: ABC transporter permease [Bryobacteraceae bacterium]
MTSHASFREALTVALGSLRASTLRSFLTLLGIILATMTLISVMSIIRGMDEYIAQTVSDLGATGYRVVRIPVLAEFNPKKWVEMRARNPQLTVEEFAFLKEHATLSDDLGMETERELSVSYNRKTIDAVAVQGVTANIGVITSVEPAIGRFISEMDDRRHLAVAVLGNDLKESFFPSVDPLGKTVVIDGLPFEVIGVAKALGSAFGQSRDTFAMIPAETYFKIYGSRTGMSFAGLARDREHLFRAQDEAEQLLRATRHLRPGQDSNFGVYTSEALVSSWDQITDVIAKTAIGIVSVFMVVGGVVIMNIMLAVVTERTHEIGIRKSVGARGADILRQFLIESSLLASAGGLAGAGAAWLMAFLVRRLTPIPMAVPPLAVVLGVGLSAAVGLFFGIYPAYRAAQLDPIEALRSEK